MVFFRKILLVCFFVVFFFIVLSCIYFIYSSRAIKPRHYYTKEGYGLSYIADDLKKNGIINNALQFKIYSKLWSIFNNCNGVKYGEYDILNNEKYSSILDKFCNGKTIVKSLTIPEGLETREIVDIINNCKDLRGKQIIFFEEGKLLPETYSFQSGTNREIILEKMKQEFLNFILKEWERRQKIDVIKTPEEAIILASIVEKETEIDEDRPIVAGVFINRLFRKMTLGSDPTVIYELTKGKYKFSRSLTKKDLLIKGDHNTYRKNGLPITPICNPGKKSILAVLHPAKTDYLYFIAKENQSKLIFAKNYKDHLKNKKLIKSKKSV